MKYVYAALLLNSADKEIDEDNVEEVMEAAGIDADESRVKALVTSLEDVDIEEAVKKQATVPAQTQGKAETEETEEEASEEEEEDEEEEEASEEDAAEGLGSLFEE